METRTDKIRRLQGLIAAEEAQKAIFEKYGSYNPAQQVQAHIDDLKSQLEHEEQLELVEANRPVVIQPTQKSWQDNIIIRVIILVIAGIIVAFIANKLFG